MQTNVIPTDGMIITEDTQLAPGVYHLPNGITIGADGVTLDGKGAQIVSSVPMGIGIRADERHHIAIRSLSISGFYHGIRIDDSREVTIEDVTIRNTQEIEGIDDFLYLWHPIEEVYGGAILYHNVQGGVIRRCDVQHQMNGVLLYKTTGVTVERCNASFNSGWGVYLSDSNDNLIADNQLDFCNRVFRRPEDGSIRVEADAAAIVLVRSSSRNQFLRNSCLCGGDGIFVAGFFSPNGVTPCNDNLFEDNDCRLSPNNAIESTFSKGNIFRRNNCSRSNYGFWMGYSWDNVLEDNLIEFNRWVGIAAEHAHDFVIRNNTIKLNGEGIRLWTRSAPGGEVLANWPGYEVAYNITLENNQLEGNRVGFAGYTGDNMAGRECHNLHLRGNTFTDNRVGALFRHVSSCSLLDNTFTDHIEMAVRLEGKPDVNVGANTFAKNGADVVETEVEAQARARW